MKTSKNKIALFIEIFTKTSLCSILLTACGSCGKEKNVLPESLPNYEAVSTLPVPGNSIKTISDGSSLKKPNTLVNKALDLVRHKKTAAIPGKHTSDDCSVSNLQKKDPIRNKSKLSDTACDTSNKNNIGGPNQPVANEGSHTDQVQVNNHILKKLTKEDDTTILETDSKSDHLVLTIKLENSQEEHPKKNQDNLANKEGELPVTDQGFDSNTAGELYRKPENEKLDLAKDIPLKDVEQKIKELKKLKDRIAKEHKNVTIDDDIKEFCKNSKKTIKTMKNTEDEKIKQQFIDDTYNLVDTYIEKLRVSIQTIT